MSNVYVAVVGIGGVGTNVLSQLNGLPSTLRPILIYVARSMTNLFYEDYRSLDPLKVGKILSSSSNNDVSPRISYNQLAVYLSHVPNSGYSILIDNTSDQSVAESYPLFLSHGISVVTPNKKSFSGSLDLWDAIQSSLTKSGKKTLLYHESTVGAGLPIISTLKDLIVTGDKITRIEGSLSGTLSFLFNNFDPAASPDNSNEKQTWSDMVIEAQKAGFTEPDPRDDLNGMDVARKVVILARLAGLRAPDPAGPDAFRIQSLIPEPLRDPSLSPAEFLAKLPQFDHEMESRRSEAQRQGKLIRYLGSVDVKSQTLKVGLELVEPTGPLAGLKGSDNSIAFYTERYGERPVIVQGAGAGGPSTASGVVGDVVKIIERVAPEKKRED